MHAPVVFIGMPAYNGERYISQAIESLLGQSFRDFVLFISDDQSSDNTEQICKDFAARDSRVVYYRQPKNIGMFENFKFVLDRANTPYFMWAAQDDLRGKEYLQTCIEKLENDSYLGLATTTTKLIDALGNTLAEESEMQKLSGTPGFMQIVRYVLQPEGLGKCNLTYGVFRTNVARIVWGAYPWRRVWGHDYHFALALISRFKVYVDQKPLFEKRLGGYSSPELDKKLAVLNYAQRKNDFPFKRFTTYLQGHLEATRHTPYQLLVASVLVARLPRVFFSYLAQRNYKKFFKFKKVL